MRRESRASKVAALARRLSVSSALVIFVWAVLNAAAHAATIQGKIVKNDPTGLLDSTLPAIFLVELRGEIKTGDAAALTQEVWPYSNNDATSMRGRVILSLDSKEGGDFAEALEISKIVRDNAISTFVGSGRECVSACALIFMAGSEKYWPDGARVEIRRVMEPGARICFHAPYKAHGKETVFEGTKAAADLLEQASTYIPHELIVALLRTARDDCRRIDIIEHAMKWGVSLWRYRPPKQRLLEGLLQAGINEAALDRLDLLALFRVSGVLRWPNDVEKKDLIGLAPAKILDVDEVKVAQLVRLNSEEVRRLREVSKVEQLFRLYSVDPETYGAVFWVEPDSESHPEYWRTVFHLVEDKKIVVGKQKALVSKETLQNLRQRYKIALPDWFMYPPETLIDSLQVSR
jgi:hypothetical protein